MLDIDTYYIRKWQTFDVVIDKPSKQEPPCSSKTKNCPMIEVGQTVKHSDEQVNKSKMKIPIKQTTILYSKARKNEIF